MTDDSLGKLLDHDDIRMVAELADKSGIDAFLVGGCIRDALLGRRSNDLDFVLSGSIEELPALFASKITGSFFWLDEKRKQGRVVKKCNRGLLIYDFAPLCGRSVEEDLNNRDFTVNALAVSLRGGSCTLIDPLCGLGDIDPGIIRMCGAKSFESDPLRLMRAVRFAAELGFAIEEATWRELCDKGSLLSGVAAERIREELFKALAAPGCRVSLRMLADSGLWRAICSEELPGDVDAGIARAAEAERLGNELAGKLAEYLEREVEGGITASSLIRLASFLGRCGVSVPLLAERLRLGREAARMLTSLCRDEGPLLASLGPFASPRQLFRFFRDREPAGPEILIVARARRDISDRALSLLLGYYLREYDPEENDLFLSGDEVMEILAIPPGKAVGVAMEKLKEAESNGVINSKGEARQFVKNLLTKVEPMR